MGKLKIPVLEWKPVQLNEAVLSGGIEGLIGIEELTDYQIENNDIKRLCNISKNKKSLNHLQPVTSKGRLRDVSQQLKKRKLKKKIKIQSPNLANLSSCELSSDSVQELSPLTSENPHCIEDEETLDVLPWTLINVPFPVAKALVELGFREPTEIQVRINYFDESIQ